MQISQLDTRVYSQIVSERISMLLALNADLPRLDLGKLAKDLHGSSPVDRDAIGKTHILEAYALEHIEAWWHRFVPLIEHFEQKARDGAYKGSKSYSELAHKVCVDAAIIAAIEQDMHGPQVTGELQRLDNNRYLNGSRKTPFLQIRGANAGLTILASLTAFLEEHPRTFDPSLNDTYFSRQTIEPLVKAWKVLSGVAMQSFEEQCIDVYDSRGVMKLQWGEEEIAKRHLIYLEDCTLHYAGFLHVVGQPSHFELVTCMDHKRPFTVLPTVQLLETTRITTAFKRKLLFMAPHIPEKKHISECPAHKIPVPDPHGKTSTVFNQIFDTYMEVFNRLRKEEVLAKS